MRAGKVAVVGSLPLVLMMCAPFGSDESTAPEPARDAATAREAGPPCSAVDPTDLVFCDDFSGITLDPLWTKNAGDESARLELDDVTFASSPRSFRASLTGASSASQDARILRKTREFADFFEVSGVVKIAKRGGVPLRIVLIEVGGKSIFLKSDASVTSDGTLIEPHSTKLDEAEFVPFRIRLSRSRIVVQIGDDEKTSELPFTPNAPPALGLGPTESNTNAPWDVYFDDIVVRAL